MSVVDADERRGAPATGLRRHLVCWPDVPRCLLVFEPPDGGVAENVKQLALGLARRGWEASVAGPGRAITYPALTAARIPIARLPFERGYGHPMHDVRALRALIGLIRRGRFDLVHVHSAKAGVLGRVAAHLTGAPVVYSPHCFPFVGPWRLPRRAFAVGVERALAPRTAAIICVAHDEQRLAIERKLGDPESLPVVHNGCGECQVEDPLDPELVAFAGGAPVVACMAVLRPQKAVHVLVEAAPRVFERLPHARIAIVGNGPLRPELEERARRLGLDHRLGFFDFKPPSSRQLRAIDLFVLPSAWEGFPISILEAMACGVPQVATDVGGTREAVEHGRTGLLCPPNEPEELADRIVELLSDPERRARMSEASRIRHERYFTLERMIDATVEVYERVLRARKCVQVEPAPDDVQARP